MWGKKIPKDYVIPEEHDPVYNYPLPPMSEFLDTKKGALYFELYLRECKSDENLAFYKAVCGPFFSTNQKVREWKSKLPEFKEGEAQTEALRIWKLFIDPSELTCINIPGEIERPITAKKGRAVTQ